VRIDDLGIHAVAADGTVIADDAQPFAAGMLVRNAQADRVYGLGERTGGLDRRGRAWTFWNTDAYDPAFGGWHPDQDPMYQSIPLEVHLGSRQVGARDLHDTGAASAFGVFTDVTRKMVIDL